MKSSSFQSKKEIEECFRTYCQRFGQEEAEIVRRIAREFPGRKEQLIAYLKGAFNITQNYDWLSKDKQLEIIVERITQKFSQAEKAMLKGPTERYGQGKCDRLDWLRVKSRYPSLQHCIKNQLLEWIYKQQKNIEEAAVPVEQHFSRTFKDEQFQSETLKLPPTLQQAWSDKDEEDFCSQRKQKKSLLAPLSVGSPNWNTLSLGPKRQKLATLFKNKLQRNEILQKYLNQEWLTLKEVKFIANTSKLSSKYVDRRTVQTANQLANSKATIDQLELRIADKIIDQFQRVKNFINNGRLKFLQNQQAAKRQRMKSTGESQSNRPSLAGDPEVGKRRAFSQAKIVESFLQTQTQTARSDGLRLNTLDDCEDEETMQQLRSKLAEQLKQRRKTQDQQKCVKLYSGGPLRSSQDRLRLQDVKCIQRFLLRCLFRRQRSGQNK